jgi:hypothetical protein
MDTTRLFLEFRKHYDAVCKYDKRRYMKYLHYTVCKLMESSRSEYSIQAQRLRDHFLEPVSDTWWEILKAMASAPLFQRLVATLTPPRYCGHRAPTFCPMCLPVRQN